MKSNLTTATILCDKYNKRANGCNDIKKITIHHMANICSGSDCAKYFAETQNECSANYCIGVNGDIVCCVEEENRAWTSGNADNDYQAITIEVSNSEIGGSWEVSQQAYESLINLVVEICNRYNIYLIYTGDSKGTLTTHNMFQATMCPGPYLLSRMHDICNQVNNYNSYIFDKSEVPSVLKVGDFVTFNNIYYTSNDNTPLEPLVNYGYVVDIQDGSNGILVSADGTFNTVLGWVRENDITIDESSSCHVINPHIKVGDVVTFIGNRDINGVAIVSYYDKYNVIEVNGSRVVLAVDDGTVFAAVDINDIEKC